MSGEQMAADLQTQMDPWRRRVIALEHELREVRRRVQFLERIVSQLVDDAGK